MCEKCILSMNTFYVAIHIFHELKTFHSQLRQELTTSVGI